MRQILILPLVCATACSGVLPVNTASRLSEGAVIATPAFDSYVTNHNGFSRVRRDLGTPADAAVIAAFEDSDPRDPAGFRNLIALNQALYRGRVSIEVLGEETLPGGPARRILRMTADQSPFDNGPDGTPVAASGRFHFRGANFAWVQAEGGPLLSAQDATGLVHMVIDFDTQSASLNLRTGVAGESQFRSEIIATDLPMNVRSGAYGGDIVIEVWDPLGPETVILDGSLRGNLGGRPEYGQGQHDMSTSGLYTGEGLHPGTGQIWRLDGAFAGRDPNVLP